MLFGKGRIAKLARPLMVSLPTSNLSSCFQISQQSTAIKPGLLSANCTKIEVVNGTPHRTIRTVLVSKMYYSLELLVYIATKLCRHRKYYKSHALRERPRTNILVLEINTIYQTQSRTLTIFVVLLFAVIYHQIMHGVCVAATKASQRCWTYHL